MTFRAVASRSHPAQSPQCGRSPLPWRQGPIRRRVPTADDLPCRGAPCEGRRAYASRATARKATQGTNSPPGRCQIPCLDVNEPRPSPPRNRAGPRRRGAQDSYRHPHPHAAHPSSTRAAKTLVIGTTASQRGLMLPSTTPPGPLVTDLYVTREYLDDRYQRAQQTISRAPRGSYISHHTAAALRGLWPPSF